MTWIFKLSLHYFLLINRNWKLNQYRSILPLLEPCSKCTEWRPLPCLPLLFWYYGWLYVVCVTYLRLISHTLHHTLHIYTVNTLIANKHTYNACLYSFLLIHQHGLDKQGMSTMTANIVMLSTLLGRFILWIIVYFISFHIIESLYNKQ